MALLLQFGLNRANSLFNNLMSWVTESYESTDSPSTLPTKDELIAIKEVGKINLSKLSNYSILEIELAHVCLKFITRGKTVISSPQNAEIIQIGFEWIAKNDNRQKVLLKLGTLSDDQTFLKVFLNEPLIVAAAL